MAFLILTPILKIYSYTPTRQMQLKDGNLQMVKYLNLEVVEG